MSGARLAAKVEFGDLLLPLYAAVFVRQYLWALDNNVLAWALTAAAVALLWFVHVRTKENVEERTPHLFWAVVALPLLAIYALRVAFPDLSFDVLNHRLIQSERALGGVLFRPGDFFPTIFPFNPSSDMLTGLTRHFLGYRLGTIINYLALLWTGTILNKLLRPFIERAVWRCLGVLLALVTEYVLFEINNYMVDLLALPLLLEALRLALNYEESERKSRDLIYGALLTGVCVALKLTNIAMAAPVILIFAFSFFKTHSLRFEARQFALILPAGVAFLAPLLPHAFYIYEQTGSPFFPLYNRLLKSPYWPDVNVYDGRWGPHGLWETMAWPLLAFKEGGRLSELAVYSGRITLGFIAAVFCLLLPRVDRRIRLISFCVLLGSVLWSATSGYIRYALFLEVLGGLLLLYLSHYLLERASGWPRVPKRAAASLTLCLLAAQCVASCVYVSQNEWGGRPTCFGEPKTSLREMRYAMRDHTLTKFLAPELRARFERVEAWIVSDIKTNGVEILLRGDVPMLAVNNTEYFDMPKSRRRFADTLREIRGRRMYSLSLTEDLDASLDYLRRRGLATGEVVPVTVPFFSTRTQLPMMLIEVVSPERHAPSQNREGQAGEMEAAPTGVALPDDAFAARITLPQAPATLRAGQTETLRVLLKNESEVAWPGQQPEWKYQLTIADRWLDARGNMVNNLDGRGILTRDLAPGEETELSLAVNAPAVPGEYTLEIDAVQEGVAWFSDKGSKTCQLKLKVEP